MSGKEIPSEDMHKIPVIVYGAGGLGREAMHISLTSLASEKYDALGYVDDSVAPGTVLNGFPVLGGGDWLENYEGDAALVFGIANSKIKAELYHKFKDKRGITFPNVIHPGASVSEYASLGYGVVIAYGCFISLDAVIGNFVFLNNSALVGHDTKIGDFTSIMPFAGIAGDVVIGERCLIGQHSAIRQGSSVGDDATVGMGSVIVSDVPEGATVVGNPIRRIR